MEFFYDSRSHDYWTQRDNKEVIFTPAKVFAIATKYQVAKLQNVSIRVFKKALSRKGWDCIEFAEAVRIVHCSTPENVQQLRATVNERILRSLDSMKYRAEVEAAISSIPGLADYLRDQRERRSKAKNGCEVNGCEQAYHYISTYCERCFKKTELLRLLLP